MKKLMTALTVSSVLFTGLGSDISEAKSSGRANVCEYEGLNGECSSYVFKATSKHVLQDLTHWNAYEPSKKALKVGRYYMVTYYHDTPVKAKLITPSKADKLRFDKRAKYIKTKQAKTKNYHRYMSYTYGL